MHGKKEFEFVLADPPIPKGFWKVEGFTFNHQEYLKITDMRTGESVIGKVLEPKGETPHVGQWRDSRVFVAFK